MPYVGSAKVKIQILGEVKGEKIKSMIYKAKSRYRKRKGFRKVYTKFKVLEISIDK
jgi:large subunit ribosomal protein L21